MAAAGKKRKSLFYAVSNGRQIGIYTSWEKAEEQVYAFKRSVFKSYTTLKKAQQAMRLKGHENPPIFDDTTDNSDRVSSTEPNIPYYSASDSDLRFDVFFDHQLNPDSSDHENKQPVLVVEHDNDLPSGGVCPTNVHSDTEIVLSYQTPLYDMHDSTSQSSLDDQKHQTEMKSYLQVDTRENIIDQIKEHGCHESYSPESPPNIEDQNKIFTSDPTTNILLQNALELIGNLRDEIAFLRNEVKVQADNYDLISSKLDNLAEINHQKNRELVNLLSTQGNNTESNSVNVNKLMTKYKSLLCNAVISVNRIMTLKLVLRIV